MHCHAKTLAHTPCAFILADMCFIAEMSGKPQWLLLCFGTKCRPMGRFPKRCPIRAGQVEVSLQHKDTFMFTLRYSKFDGSKVTN